MSNNERPKLFLEYPLEELNKMHEIMDSHLEKFKKEKSNFTEINTIMMQDEILYKTKLKELFQTTDCAFDSENSLGNPNEPHLMIVSKAPRSSKWANKNLEKNSYGKGSLVAFSSADEDLIRDFFPFTEYEEVDTDLLKRSVFRSFFPRPMSKYDVNENEMKFFYFYFLLEVIISKPSGIFVANSEIFNFMIKKENFPSRFNAKIEWKKQGSDLIPFVFCDFFPVSGIPFFRIDHPYSITSKEYSAKEKMIRENRQKVHRICKGFWPNAEYIKNNSQPKDLKTVLFHNQKRKQDEEKKTDQLKKTVNSELFKKEKNKQQIRNINKRKKDEKMQKLASEHNTKAFKFFKAEEK